MNKLNFLLDLNIIYISNANNYMKKKYKEYISLYLCYEYFLQYKLLWVRIYYVNIVDN